MLNLFREQPRAFHMIFMLELWERFGFYTVQGILILYFIRYLNYNHTDAYYLFGAYSALVYGMVLIGGYLGDKVLGIKRTIVLGLIVLALGYFFLALANKQMVFYALGLICVGNGLFKANPSNLLSKCYEEGDPRLYGGFTLYYMAINLGSIFALFAGPTMVSHYGYSAAYVISALGLVVGLISYFMRQADIAHITDLAQERPLTIKACLVIFLGLLVFILMAAHLLQHVFLAKRIVWAIAGLAIGFYCYLMSQQTVIARLKMGVALVLMVEAVLFFSLYQQMPTSLNLFAVHHVTPSLLGIPIDAQSFQALNPMWILIMSPILAFMYGKIQENGWNFSVPYKFAVGMTMCALSFLVLWCIPYVEVHHVVVSSGWLVISYFFQSLGELLVSALGVAMVAELVPAEMAGFVMGIWFLTSALAGFIGAQIASYTAIPEQIQTGLDSLLVYTQVFGGIGLATLILAVCMWFFAPFLNRCISMIG